MSARDIWLRFQALKIWHSNGLGAPHKPLLALWASLSAWRDVP